MKGALGSALILNLVITFIFIFFSLLIGSMAYSRAYKVKNYILNSLVLYDETNGLLPANESTREKNGWNSMVNGYLSNVGYMLSTKANTCPNDKSDSYKILRNTNIGGYDYCIYYKEYDKGKDILATKKYTYRVITYMRFDLPFIGDFFKVRMTGESKLITKYE